MARASNDTAAGYKSTAADTSDASARVATWRRYIASAQVDLKIQERIDAAIEGDKYLDGTKTRKNAIYLRYLPPLLEDSHRRTLPRIPTASVEGRSVAGDSLAEGVQKYLDGLMLSGRGRVEETARALLWDDDRFGIAIGKTVWQTALEYNDQMPSDENVLALEIERAESEHADPTKAVLGDRDIHAVHIATHNTFLQTLTVGTPEYDAMLAHVEDHSDNVMDIRAEWPMLERIGVDRFVYDTSVPWHRRGWEAELKSVRIQSMLAAKYKNVNPGNCPAELRDGENQADLRYEDMTARIWEIHDRRHDKYEVISADGPEDGLFLYQSDWDYGDIDVYVPLVFRPYQPEQTHGLSTIQMALPILDRLADVDFHIDRHVKTHSDYKMLLPKGFDQTQLKQGLNNPNQRFIEVPPEALAGIKPYQPPEIPATLLLERERLLGELRRVTGADAQNVAANATTVQTATESGIRQQSHEERKGDRQETMGKFLAAVARNFLELARTKGTRKTDVRLVDDLGPGYTPLDPTSIPKDMDVFMDIQAQTEDAKAEDLMAIQEAVKVAQAVGYPLDPQKWWEYAAARAGIRRPERFRAAAPSMEQDPSAMNGPQMPSMPGQSPVIQPQNNTVNNTTQGDTAI